MRANTLACRRHVSLVVQTKLEPMVYNGGDSGVLVQHGGLPSFHAAALWMSHTCPAAGHSLMMTNVLPLHSGVVLCSSGL